FMRLVWAKKFGIAPLRQNFLTKNSPKRNKRK
ncbi:MAG: hypothetical protein ACI85I_002801, partial [Arenicella sp.]